jgi:hypothetical protein
MESRNEYINKIWNSVIFSAETDQDEIVCGEERETFGGCFFFVCVWKNNTY